MSVRSKALCFAILVGAALLVGCATNRISANDQETVAWAGESGPETAEEIASAEEGDYEGEAVGGVYGDLAEQDNPASGALEVFEAPDVSDAQVTDSREILNQVVSEDQVFAINMESGSGFSKLNVDTGIVEPVVDVMMLESPSRLVVDVIGAGNVKNEEVSVEQSPYIENVRVGTHEGRARVVFDLRTEVSKLAGLEHSINADTGRLTVTFFDPVGQPSLSQPIVSDEQLAELAEPLNSELGEATLPEGEVVDEEIEAGAGELLASAEVEEGDEAAEQEVEVAALPDTEENSDNNAVSDEEESEQELESASEETEDYLNLELTALSFTKTNDNEGQVVLDLSDQVAFRMERTAPSEYVLSIPAASAAEGTTYPVIAPKGTPGIRSARAVQKDGSVEVRMFVDQGVQLQAFPRGTEIVVQALEVPLAENPQARAQLEPGEEDDGLGADDSQARQFPTGIRSSDGSKIYTGRLISLDLQDTDIDNALRIIAEVSNLNIIASDDVSGKVTLRLIDVPWDQALDVILKTNGLDQVTEGNVIRIAPVDKLRQEREALREAKRAAENLEDLTVQYIRVSYARVGELVEQVQAVLSERGTVAEDQRTNQLIIKDIKKGHDQSIELVKRLDLRTPQVLLETQIVEGQRNILRDLGFQWNFSYTASPATGNATGMNFPNSVTVGGATSDAGGGAQISNFPAVIGTGAGSAISAVLDSADGGRSLSARLSTLETEGKVKVVSRPQVSTVNNKTAEIKSVETIRVRLPDSGTSVATGSGAQAAGGGRTAFEEIDVGIELSVTPQASPDYYVLMDLEARSSTFGSTIVDNIPSTLEREATSTILVKSGQTFALGGVYRIEDTDRIEGVPWLKDIPFVGWLFRRSFIDKGDEELIFFITPHIVEGSFDPSLM